MLLIDDYKFRVRARLCGPRNIPRLRTASCCGPGLADLVGLGFDDRLLVVIGRCEGPWPRRCTRLLGAKALIERCTVHKRRNVPDRLPDKDIKWVDAKVVKAFGRPTRSGGCTGQNLAGPLERNRPTAAGVRQSNAATTLGVGVQAYAVIRVRPADRAPPVSRRCMSRKMRTRPAGTATVSVDEDVG